MHDRIPNKIAALNFPDIEGVVLAGSGVLEENGIRPARDIDLATTMHNIEHLFISQPGQWRAKINTFNRIRDGEPFQVESFEDVTGEFDIWNETWYHPGRPVGNRIVTLDELIANSTQHKLGFYVVNLEFDMEMRMAMAPESEKYAMDVRRYHQWREQGY